VKNVFSNRLKNALSALGDLFLFFTKPSIMQTVCNLAIGALY
jgi:hypothetical protein